MVSKSSIGVALGALPLAFAAYPDAAYPAAAATYTSVTYPVTNGTATSVSAPSGTGSAGSPTQTVAVGKDGLKFTPDTIIAKTGDEIVFEFFPKNHAVVQADFNNPCNPSADGHGIFSGFIPSTAGRANKTFTIKVEDEKKPIWLYCPQNAPMPHCAAGMVAVINPPQSGHNTLNAFRMAAASKGNSTLPSTGPSGGQFGTPGATGSAPAPSGTKPVESPGAGSSIAVNGMLGLAALFAGFAL